MRAVLRSSKRFYSEVLSLIGGSVLCLVCSTDTLGQNITVYDMSNTPVFGSNSFSCIGVGAGGRVWTGTNGQGAYQYDGSAWTLLPGFTTHNFRDIATDANGGIWVAQSGYTGVQSINGGVRYYPGSDINVYTSWGGLTGLQTRSARSIEVNPATGVAYVACSGTTTGGIPDPGGFSWGDPTNGFQASVYGLVGEDMACLAVGLVGGEVWVGADRSCETNGTCFAPRIVRYNSSGGYTGQFFDESVLPVDNSSGTARIRAIKADGAGRVWVGFSGGGVRVFTLATQQWEAIAEPIIPSGTAVNFNAISVGQDGKVYIGSTAGLVVYKGSGSVLDSESYSLLTTAEGLPSNSVNQIAFDSIGNVWMATSAGIARFGMRVLKHLCVVNFTQTQLIAESTTVTQTDLKMCADGSDASKFEFIIPGFVFSSETRYILRSNPDNVVNDALGFMVDDPIVGDTIRSRMLHPKWINIPSGELYVMDTLYIIDTSTQDTLFRNGIRFYRAPLLLTHGFNDFFANTFGAVESLLSSSPSSGGLYPGYESGQLNSPLIQRNDWGWYSYAGFSFNKNRVPNGIDKLLQKARDNGYAAGKVIAIGHSLGGILARLYLQSSVPGGIGYRNDISKLITINTPHRGSQGANMVLNMEGPAAAYALKEFGFGSPIIRGEMGFLIGSLPKISGAIQDLRVDSQPLRRWLNIPQEDQEKVPSAVLASDGQSDVNSKAVTIRAIIAATRPNLFAGEQNDLVVALSSQLCDVPVSSQLPGSVPVLSQWHGRSPDNGQIKEQFKKLIDADPAEQAGFFSHQGFPQGYIEYPRPEEPTAERGGNEQVEIVAPLAGATYPTGATVTVDLSFTSGISSMTLFASGEGFPALIVQSPAAPQLQFTLPEDATGRVDLFVFASDVNGLLASDSSHIFVIPPAPPDSIALVPNAADLPLGLYYATDVKGYFNGSILPLAINEVPDLVFTFDGALLDQVAPGIFRGVALGSTEVMAQYEGASSTMTVNVIDDPSLLSAMVAYSTDEVCVGGSITFTNQSIGLVTGLQWTFQGGTPSSSTDPTVEVAYETPGEYAVTLSATFVNGQNTTTLDSLIFVAGAPDTLVINTGSTLEAADGDYTYQWYDCATSSDIEGATEPNFTPATNGSYAVRLTNGACTLASACHTVLSEGIPESVFSNGIELHPNPNDGSFVLMLDKPAQSAHVEIVDVMGRIVMRTGQLESQRVAIHFDGAPGVYTVRAIVDGTGRTVRMVKW